ncbi:meiotic nuclear division protein 1 [Crassisporium funariophilum]|nr:meiotic nuclear division protein 1 [Crassisporium funariophilum]
MAPRGLSGEEKRVKLLEIFHESRDFFQLKELEKLGPKLKGIVSQTVKDVLQSLVDDGLVQADKIGSSNFYWSFPSQQGVLLETKLNAVKENRAISRTHISILNSKLVDEKAERINSDDRVKALKKLTRLEKDLTDLKAELNAYGDSNPAKVEEAKRATFLAKEAAYRWTDNYGMLLAHFTRQNGIGIEDIRQYLGIEEEYEDLD